MNSSELTDKQRHIIDLTSTGLTEKEIAYQLGVSLSNIQQHLKQTCKKLGAKNAKQAVALHVRQQLISRIRSSGAEETMRAFILQETGAEALDELSIDNGLLEICKYINQVLDSLDD